MPQTSTKALPRTAALLALALAVTGTATAGATVRATGGAGAATVGSRVVVTALSGDLLQAVQAVQSAGGRVLDRLPLIGAVSAILPTGHLVAPGFRVIPDRRLNVAAAADSPNAGLPIDDVRTAVGLPHAANGEGAGISVAVVDTGVADVPDLAGRVTHLNVSGERTGAQGPDGFGHGTFVAGLVAGNGRQSGGAHTGIAPGAQVLDVKVADNTGSTSLIQVLKGLEAVADNPSVRVVNLSLSSNSPLPYQLDPLDAALETLWRRGVTVVVPAGNDGPTAQTITSPGSDPVLLTAGALQDNGGGSSAVAAWSGVGPAPQGVAKPDLVAPGAHVVSLRAPGSVVDQQNPKAVVEDNYFRGSGTSFSTAVTTGAVAALLTREPQLTPDQVKKILTGSAQASPGLTDRNSAGAGGLDVAKAYTMAVPADASAPAGAVDGDKGHGNTKADEDSTANAGIPGDPAAWARFVDSLGAGDAAAAASSWSQLSEAARNWASSSWSGLHPDARNWATSYWGARNWAGASAEEWAARNWAASSWSARNWAASSWSARNWAAGSWSARNWAASSWSARNWAAGNWAAGNWAAGNWAAGNWAAGNWAAGNWAAGNWAAGNWAAGNWAAGNWAAGDWS